MAGGPTALRALKQAAVAADRLTPSHQGVTVLIYHRVGGGSGTQIDLSPERFAEQLALLSQQYRPVNLDEALDALRHPRPPGPDLVVVTFDDGTADFAEYAVPLLVEHDVPATVYVATAHIEEGRPFPGAGAPVSWSALQDCVSTGLVTLGSHTHNHALLDRVPPDQAADELDRSIGLIADRVGVAADHFAYPKAVAAEGAVEMQVRKRFRSAALAGTRANRYEATDPHRLARSPIQQADGMSFFARKVAGGMALEDRVRQLMNRRRYAGLTT